MCVQELDWFWLPYSPRRKVVRVRTQEGLASSLFHELLFCCCGVFFFFFLVGVGREGSFFLEG